MNPKQFLTFGGVVLVLVGLLGFLGVIGPTAEASLFGATWWFDNGENWAHTILGVAGLVAAFTFPPVAQKWLVGVLAVVALVVAVAGFAVSGKEVPNFLGANLENVADNILHLVVGAWAGVSFMGKE